MSGRSEVRKILLRTVVLIGGVFILTVLLAAMPGHRVPVVDAQSPQEAHVQGANPHRTMTPTRPNAAGEKQNAAARPSRKTKTGK